MNTPRLTTIFTKRPLAGHVKTRLSPPLTPEEAAELALAMLDDAVELHRNAPYRTELAVAPETSVAWFEERYPGVPVSPQTGAGLGERLAHWFDARARPGTSVVVVGSDCPELSQDVVEEAHGLLGSGTDAVFTPDGGGGYSLVGLARPCPELFREVPMSTATMFAETLALARSLGVAVAVLEEHRDVDGPKDLERLARLDPGSRSSTMAASPAAPLPARTLDWLRRWRAPQPEHPDAPRP